MRRVFVFGDSTTCEYPESAFPQQGWAHFLPDYLKEDVEVINVARGGWSLKSFLYSPDYISGKALNNEPKNSHWNAILREVCEGDFFVFYWGGINDMGQICADGYRPCAGGEYIRDDFFTDKEVYMNVGVGFGTHNFFTLRTTPAETAELLSGMIMDVAERGAIPIVCKGTGKYYKLMGEDKCVFAANHKYASAVCDAAKTSMVPYFNIADTFEEEFDQIGYQAMIDKYFMSRFASQKFLNGIGEEAATRDNDDNVHYNVDGARYVCELFIEKLQNTDCELKNCIK